MYKDSENTAEYNIEQWLEYCSTTTRSRSTSITRELIVKLEEDSLVTVMSPMSIYNDLPVDLQVHLESSAKSMVTRLVRSESSTQIKQFDLLHSLVMSLQIKNTQKSERVVITSATTKTIFVQIPIKPSPTVLSPLRVQLKCTPRTIHVSCAVILENPYDRSRV